MEEVLLGKYLLPGAGKVKADRGVVIKDDKIKKVAPNDELLAEYSGEKIKDYRDKVIAPGFINSHMHSYGVLSHGIPAPDVDSFESFLNDFWWPLVENRIDHKMIEITTEAMAARLINSGVTSFCNVMEAPGAIPGALKKQAEVLDEIGIRAVLSFEACERISEENGKKGLKENRDFYLEYKDHPLISGMMCIHTTFTCSEEFIKKAGKMARELGSGIQMHLSESSYEVDYCQEKYNKLPVEIYEKNDYLRGHVLASQGVKLTEKELEIIAKKEDINIAHVPLSNCEVGGGIAPVPAMLKKGINVGLGTDGYINNFFEVMRAAFLIHKANHENPEIMPAREVFKLATENGSKTLGQKGIGTIEPGKQADIITIASDLMTPLTEDNIFEQLILYRNPHDVKEVYVNGKLLKENGKLRKFNMEKLKKKLNEEARRLWEEVK